ncbi:MAG TPA: UDP-glucose/GDP-mannose dehydrogenase family protein [Acidimicrobiales bacterium]|nr:UDP-glucose/GDP-mannose dehydrogenase family protein [Acidimicrobiales bacterium]
MSKVAVIGTGYVGLTLGAVLAHVGHEVCCADLDPDKVAMLASGRIPIVEAGLPHLVREGLATGRFRVVLGAGNAVAGREFVFLCLPTPEGADGSADLSFLVRAAAEIGPLLDPGSVVVNKSTVPVGSTRVVEDVLGRDDVAVVSNPEFLRESSAVHDSLHPERVIIGADDREAAQRVADLFAAVGGPVMITDPASAETIKYACNAFLATKVSFVNAVANLCEAVGADVADVVRGMGYDRRIGHEFLQPGPGWGGSCLPKDTAALVRIGEDAGYDFHLLRGVITVNRVQLATVVAKIARLAGGALQRRTVAVWGLTFKAGTDDRRCSPAMEVVSRILAKGGRVRAYDPTVDDPVPEAPDVEVCRDPYAACEGAAVLAVLTEWEELRCLDFDKVAAVMANPAVVDARNLLPPEALRRAGFTYQGIGRR